MPITIDEKFDSRGGSESYNDSRAELRYVVQGSDDEVAVRNLVQTTIPDEFLGLLLQGYDVDPKGGGVWEIAVNYSKAEPKQPGDSTYQFDTTGGTAHITQSKQTISSYRAGGGVAPNYQGAIGVTSDSVEGTEIVVPVFSWSEIHYVPRSLVTATYRRTLFLMTGKVNGAAWREYAAGEVLFQGASGSVRGKEDFELSFKFAASPNLVNLTIGSMTGINKEGWHYLWVRYRDDLDQNTLIKTPAAAYVERTYDYGDFTQLGLG